jgi:hypothetical protein
MQFAKLVAYQQRFGHCQVPKLWPEDPRFANWVRYQRSAYATNVLRPECQHRLEQIGFNWLDEAPAAVSWADRLAQLAAFKARFGHCDLHWQSPEEPELGRWASAQRRLWRKSRLNNEQIRWLKELGFNWSLREWKPKHAPSRPRVSSELAALNLRWEQQMAVWRNG